MKTAGIDLRITSNSNYSKPKTFIITNLLNPVIDKKVCVKKVVSDYEVQDIFYQTLYTVLVCFVVFIIRIAFMTFYII